MPCLGLQVCLYCLPFLHKIKGLFTLFAFTGLKTTLHCLPLTGLNWKVDLHCLPFTGLMVDLKIVFHNPRTLDADLGHWLDHMTNHMTRTFIMWPGWGPQFHMLDIHNTHSCLQLFQYPLPQLPFSLLSSDYTHNQYIASPDYNSPFDQFTTQWTRQLCSHNTVKKTVESSLHSNHTVKKTAVF